MDKFTEKLSKLTPEQSRALSKAMNAGYNNKGGKSSTNKAKKPPSKKK